MEDKKTLTTEVTGTTRPKLSAESCPSCYYLTGLGSTLRVGNDLHCDYSIGFFLYVKMTQFRSLFVAQME